MHQKSDNFHRTKTRAKTRLTKEAIKLAVGIDELGLLPHVNYLINTIRRSRSKIEMGPGKEFDLRITVQAGERIPFKYLRAGVRGVHSRLKKAGFTIVETEFYQISPVAPSAHDGPAQPATGA